MYPLLIRVTIPEPPRRWFRRQSVDAERIRVHLAEAFPGCRIEVATGDAIRAEAFPIDGPPFDGDALIAAEMAAVRLVTALC